MANSTYALTQLAGAVTGGNNLLRFVTSIKYSASVAKMINNMTFLYDPTWEMGNYEQNTLPFCFYFVKGYHEVSQNNVSQKQMLFYNSQSASNVDMTNGGLLNVVADNIVLQPREYRLDVLVPFQTDAYFDQFQLDPTMLINIPAFMLTGENASGALAGSSQVVTNMVSIIRMLFQALSVDISISGIVNMLLGQNDINKVSLDAMRDSRAILKMKVWNGWRFKYVAIKNIEVRKSGEYEQFYEGTITVQEMPVMTLANSKKFGSKVNAVQNALNSILRAKSRAVKKASETAMDGASKATGGE